MNKRDFRLSIEELAFAMGLLGGTNMASGFLMAVIGDRSQQEVEGRLFAASHSLVARGLLELDIEKQTRKLDEALLRSVQMIVENDFSLRCSRTSGGVEETITFFVRQQELVQHQTWQGVVSHIETFSEHGALLDRSAQFFSLGGTSAGDSADRVIGTIPVSVLEKIRALPPNFERKEAVALLEAASLPHPFSVELADDFSNLEYRGSVIRVEQEQSRLLSNRGFLLLKGPRRYWLFELVAQEPPLAKVFRGTEARYRELVRQLTA